MRILILGINYWPERTSVAPFTTGLSEHLAAQGHHVRVITAFPYYPEWRIWDSYRGRITQKEIIKGVEVRRVLHFIPWKPSSLLQRLVHDFSFAVSASIAGIGSGEWDVIYCSSPPPAVALAAYLLSVRHGVPFTIKLTDLASEAALATNILRQDGFAIRTARRLEDFVYRKAAAVFCLCDAFIHKLTARGIAWSKLHRIPDWADTESIRPMLSDGSFRMANGIPPGHFVALHTGNMGKKQDLMNIVRAAETSQGDENLLWVLVGEGEERKMLESEIAARKLSNLRLLPLQPASSMAQMYAAADVLVLNQKASVKDAVIPSKLLTYMSSGRPIIAAVSDESEATRQIREANCGLVVTPEDPQALIDGIKKLRSDQQQRLVWGSNGRSYAEANYTKLIVLNSYDKMFGSMLPKPADETCVGIAALNETKDVVL